jgi:hypothetical protein
MRTILVDSLSAQVAVHRWDGHRLSQVMDAMAGLKGFGVELSEAKLPLSQQLDDVAVFVITSRLGRPPATPAADVREELQASIIDPSPAYSVDDVDAITRFVERGGGLLLMTNHGDLPGHNPWDWTRHDSQLAAALGIVIEPAWFAESGAKNSFPDVEQDGLQSEHPIIRGAEGSDPVRRLRIGMCCALTPPAGVEPLVRLPAGLIDWRDGRNPKDYCFAVALDGLNGQQGRVVVTARSGFLGSSGITFPGPGLIQEADNLPFVLNSVRWLAHDPAFS